jgi:hypothetical protein
MLVAGGLGHGTGGVFATMGPISGSTHWGLLGTGLPNADVQQVVYNAAANVLVAAPFGRGAWTLANFIAPTATTVGNVTAGFRPSTQLVTPAAVTRAAVPASEGTVTFTGRHRGRHVHHRRPQQPRGRHHRHLRQKAHPHRPPPPTTTGGG